MKSDNKREDIYKGDRNQELIEGIQIETTKEVAILQPTDMDEDTQETRPSPEEEIISNVKKVLEKQDATKTEIYNAVQEIVGITTEINKLEDIMPLLKYHAGYYSQSQPIIRTILQKYGQHLRKITKADRSLEIRIETINGQYLVSFLHPQSRVSKLRNFVNEMIGEADGMMMIITINGYSVDDDEYLMECGCTPKEVNYAYIYWESLQRPNMMQLLTSKETDNIRRQDDLITQAYEISQQSPCAEVIIDGTQLNNDEEDSLTHKYDLGYDTGGQTESNTQTTPKETKESKIQTLPPRPPGRPPKNEPPGKYAETKKRTSMWEEKLQPSKHPTISNMSEEVTQPRKEIPELTNKIDQTNLSEEEKLNNIFKQTLEWTKVLNRLSQQEGTSSQVGTVASWQNKSLPIAILLILTLFGIPSVKAIVGYDCSAPMEGPKYSLRDIDECPDATPIRLDTGTKASYYVYQESDFLRTTARECIVKRASSAWYCGTSSYSAMVVPKTAYRTLSITSANCESAFQTGEIKIEEGIKIKVKKGQGVDERIIRHGNLKQDGTCSNVGIKTVEGYTVGNAVVVEDYHVELRVYQVAFDAATGIMLGGDKCSAKHTECDTGESIIIYSINFQSCTLTQVKFSEFIEVSGKKFKDKNDDEDKITQGVPTKNHSSSHLDMINTPTLLVSTRQEEMMRFMIKEDVSRCGVVLHATNYPGLFVSKKIISAAKTIIDKTDINMNNYFNNKIDFLYHKNLMKIERVYQETIANDCKLNREILRTKLALVMTNQDMVAPLLPLSKGTFARVMGEAIHTFKCKEINVELADAGYCTNELPVSYEGQIKFLEPITRVLITTPVRQLQCSEALAPYYEWKPGTWISLPHRHVKKTPKTIELMKLQNEESFRTIKSVSEGGLYTQKEINDARKFLMFPEKRSRVITELVHRALKEGDSDRPDFDLLLSPDHFKKATQATLQRIWGKFLVFGQATAGLMGIYLICMIVKVILSQILNTLHIYKMAGFTWKLVLGCCPLMARHVLFELNLDAMKERLARRAATMENDEDELVELKANPIEEYKENFENMRITRQDNKISAPTELPKNKIYPVSSLDEYKKGGRHYFDYILDGSYITTTVKINDQLVQGILDTGATVSSINYELLTKEQRKTKQKDKRSFKTADNHRIRIRGVIKTDIQLFGICLTRDLRAISDMPVNCIMGLDIIRELESRRIKWLWFTPPIIYVEREEHIYEEIISINTDSTSLISITKDDNLEEKILIKRNGKELETTSQELVELMGPIFEIKRSQTCQSLVETVDEIPILHPDGLESQVSEPVEIPSVMPTLIRESLNNFWQGQEFENKEVQLNQTISRDESAIPGISGEILTKKKKNNRIQRLEEENKRITNKLNELEEKLKERDKKLKYKNRYPCSNCNRIFQRQGILRNHIITEHQGDKVLREAAIANVLKDMVKGRGRIESRDNEPIATIERWKYYALKTSIFCSLCGKEYQTQYQMEQHWQWSHIYETRNRQIEKIFITFPDGYTKCKDCNNIYPAINMAKNHWKKQHQKNTMSAPEIIKHRLIDPRLLWSKIEELKASYEEPTTSHMIAPIATIHREGPTPFLKVRLNGQRIDVLLDTGSGCTIINEKFIKLTAEDREKAKTERVTGATGDFIEMVGVVECEYLIVGQVIKHNTLIASSKFKYDGIIGMDLLTRLRNAKLDLTKGQLISEEDTIHGEDIEVRITENIRIPPRTEVVIQGTISCQTDGDILFEPNENFINKYEIPIAHGICAIKRYEIPVRMTNGSEKAVQLYPGTKIGTATPIHELVEVIQETSKYKIYPNIDLTNSDISEEEKKQMQEVLEEYSNVIAKHEYDLGRTSVIKHTIPLTNEQPIKQRAYRIPYAQQDEVKTLIKGMEENEIIRRSSSPWTSPVVMVKKKDGSMRFCVDYRKLNEVTRKDTYPLPRIDEMLDKLGHATIFTTLDLQSGYWQIEVEEMDKPKTAFSTGNDLWEFNKLPFGLTGAPATFQRCMNFMLMDTTHAMVYIDDIIIFSTTFSEHLDDLREVLERLWRAGLKVKPSKCEFAKKKVKFLGHIVSADGIQPDPTNTDKVKNFKPPKTVKEIQQFLGLASYYRRFIKNFAHIAAPLSELTRRDKDFIWTERQQKAFEELKERLLNPPILRYPDMKKGFLLMTDASGFAIGAVLGQKDDKEKDHVIAYASRSLKSHEKNYSTIEREALAIVFATKQFRHYIWAKQVLLLTDQRPLVWLMKHKDSSSRLIRWALQLQEYDIEIQYRTGKSNANADCLSRIPEEITVAVISRKISTATPSMLKAQEEDDDITQIRRVIENKTSDRSQLRQELRNHLSRNEEKYIFDKGILKYLDTSNELTVLPQKFRTEILMEYHDGALGGHLSTRKTIGRIRKKYYWPGMEKDVKQWCFDCRICATRRDTGKRTKVPLKPILPPSAPMETTAMDVLGPLPESDQGNKYIIVFCDYFTKWAEAYPMPDQKAETIAQIFVEQIIFRYGVPKKLITDQGTNFLSELLNAISKLFKIMRIHTSPYHPQTDGLVERFNRTLANMLSSYTNAQQTDWDVHIPSCLFAYRSAPHASTGETPFYLMYLRNHGMPEDLKWIKPQSQYLDVPDYKILMLERLEKAWTKAGLAMRYNQETMKEAYDRKTKDHKFDVGDLVMIHQPLATKGLSNKLQRPFKGPYRVLQVTQTNLLLKNNENKKAKPKVIHVNRCKLAPPEITKPRYELRSHKQKGTIAYIGSGESSLNLPLQIGEHKVNALVDTGSPISILHIKLLDEMQRSLLIPVSKPYYSITGERIPIEGALNTVIAIQGIATRIQFIVFTKSRVDAIIGLNLIQQLAKQNIDWAKIIKIGKMQPVIGMIKSESEGDSPNQVATLKLIEELTKLEIELEANIKTKDTKNNRRKINKEKQKERKDKIRSTVEPVNVFLSKIRDENKGNKEKICLNITNKDKDNLIVSAPNTTTANNIWRYAKGKWGIKNDRPRLIKMTMEGKNIHRNDRIKEKGCNPKRINCISLKWNNLNHGQGEVWEEDFIRRR